MDPIRFLIFLLLAAILTSLGTALYHLASGHRDSGRMLRALSWRIGLSVGLFALLLIAWQAGLIAPHGLGR